MLVRASEAEPGSVLVAIIDSGSGLPQANLDRLFEAFYTTKASGLGMGLSICRSIVQNHRGTVMGNAEPASRRCLLHAAADRGKIA